MANYLSNLGIDFLTETEAQTEALFRYIVKEGKSIVGYSGSPYINHHFGDVQMILRLHRNDQEKHLEFSGFDTHASGKCVWDVRITGMDMTDKDADFLQHRIVVNRKEDHGGLAVVNVVNADVLPSFAEGTEVKLQMIAFPSSIAYFEDEDAYAQTQPDWHDGKLLLGDGTFFPAGLMLNRNPDSEVFEQNDEVDDLMLVRGTVKGLYRGMFRLDEEEHDAYIRCIIGTEFGDLEIVHTIEDVEEEQRNHIRKGATVSAMVRLSGDAAIYEYENGMLFDEPHDLAILYATVSGADAERMRYVFAEDASYLSEYSGITYEGRDAIIDRLKFVGREADVKYFAHMATITSVDDEALPYKVGKRCIVLAADDPHNYESIAFIDVNEKGQIFKLVTSTNSQYRFKLDEKPRVKFPLDGVVIPETVLEPMVTRAKFHRVIDMDIPDQVLIENTTCEEEHMNNVEKMLEHFLNHRDKTVISNMFGYLFAKAIELEYVKNYPSKQFQQISYSVEDIKMGCIQSELPEELQIKLEKAMKLGSQFYKDLILFYPEDEAVDDNYEADLVNALLLVQKLGKMYSCKYMIKE